MATDAPAHPRRSIGDRLDFAAGRLFWDGSINRDDIVRRFGVSHSQATADLARLREALGDGMTYDVVRRTYVPSAAMPVPPLDADGLLQQLRLIGEGQLAPEAGVLSAPPPLAVAGALSRSVGAPVLRAALAAIRDGLALEAHYVSFQRAESGRRVLSPHALVFDGFRWHARAHDAEDGRFKDFVLARLADPAAAGPARATAADDAAWTRHVALEIAPHPGLTAHQQSVVARDYGMRDGRLRLPVRAAVAFYAKKRLGLVDGHAARPPNEQQIVLVAEYDMEPPPA
jgi:hypothetical protein